MELNRSDLQSDTLYKSLQMLGLGRLGMRMVNIGQMRRLDSRCHSVTRAWGVLQRATYCTTLANRNIIVVVAEAGRGALPIRLAQVPGD